LMNSSDDVQISSLAFINTINSWQRDLLAISSLSITLYIYANSVAIYDLAMPIQKFSVLTLLAQ